MSNIKFTKLHNVNNPTSIHGIYPYRGKIASVEAKLICEQLPKNSILLDPFCGSGTIVFEGACNHLNVYGVDNNPLAIELCKGKLNSLKKGVTEIENEVNDVISKAKKTEDYEPMPDMARKHFHKETANEIMQALKFFDNMSDYSKAAFLGAIALAARGCNHYKWTSSTVGKDINPKRYIPFFKKFKAKAKNLAATFWLTPGCHLPGGIALHLPKNDKNEMTFMSYLAPGEGLPSTTLTCSQIVVYPPLADVCVPPEADRRKGVYAGQANQGFSPIPTEQKNQGHKGPNFFAPGEGLEPTTNRLHVILGFH